MKLVVVAFVFLNELFGSVFILDDTRVRQTCFYESIVANCHYATSNNLVAFWQVRSWTIFDNDDVPVDVVAPETVD